LVMAPVRLRLVASGLIIEKVRSIAIFRVLYLGFLGCGALSRLHTGKQGAGTAGTRRMPDFHESVTRGHVQQMSSLTSTIVT
jgi:hypothetical protein